MRTTDTDTLIGGLQKREIVLADYDDSWPEKYEEHASLIRDALGETAISIEHVGSTSVPGIAAKPIIDVLVVVEDSSDESRYLPALIRAGYELRVREPEWNEHRMLRTPEFDVHIHVFSLGCAEIGRMLAFRDRLRRSPPDRVRYESLKRELAKKDWPDMNAYAAAKTELVESILAEDSRSPLHDRL